MPPPLQDQFIDDEEEEEFCPLCVEELDLTDKNFRPCPCGYQICQFCYNNIKTTMNGLCPACRRPYDDKNIQYKSVSPEEMAQHKQAIAQQAKKKAAARQKEAQKREAENLSRKHLSGLRVRQKNLVYVTGLKPKATGERLVEILRGKEFFGQYGDIVKIVVSKSKDADKLNQSVGIYITFVRREDARTCIDTINGLKLDDGTKLHAAYGTTKYCSAFLRGETCSNRNCMFLHETGDDSESFTRQDLSNLNAMSTQQPASIPVSRSPQPQAPPQHTHPIAAAIQDTEQAVYSLVDIDGPALPPSASWADQARRASRTTNTSTDSPLVTNSELHATEKEESSQVTEDALESQPIEVPDQNKPTQKKARKPKYPYFDDLLKLAFNPNLSFNFRFPDHFTDKDRFIVENMPPLFDPREGTRRRLIREREAEELLTKQAEAQAEMKVPALEPDEAPEQAGGSSQLGGEPEERIDRGFSQQNLLQQQAIGSSSLGLGQPAGFEDESSSLGTVRAMGQQHTQQMLLQQLHKFSTLPGSSTQPPNHGRHPSRFFLNEAMGTASKNYAKQANALYSGNAGHGQSASSQFAFSSVQGPPPGLKTTGTPPVTGGGIFAQGHGFTTPAVGYGRENDKMWDFHRGRTNTSGPDAGKHTILNLGPPVATDTKVPFPAVDETDFPALPKPAAMLTSRKLVPSVPPGLGAPPGISTATPRVAPYPVAVPVKQPKQPFPIARAGNTLLSPSKGPAEQSSPVEENNAETNKEREGTVPDQMDVTAIDKPTSTLIKTGTRTTSKTENTKPSSTSAVNSRRQSKADGEEREEISTILRSDEATTPKVSQGKEQIKVAPENESSTKVGKRPVPGTLKIATVAAPEKDGHAPKGEWAKISRPSSVAPSPGSRPATPGGEVLSTPIKRTAAPRTLRITETPKTETPPALDNDEILPLPNIQPGSKVSSRRPGMASMNQPATPVSETVDVSAAQSPSVDVSRTSSPPPVMGKKRAEKKTKKPKKKDVEQEIPEASSSKPVEEQSPILGRKKKTKKPGAGPLPLVKKPAQSSPVVSRPGTPTPVIEETTVDQQTEVKPEQEVPQAASVAHEEINEPEFFQPAPKSKRKGESIFAGFGDELDRILSNSSFTKTVSMKSHLNNTEHHLSNRPFSHPADLDAYIASKDPFVPSPAENALRQAGEAIRRSDPDNRLSSRIIETPRGSRLRCLTEAEENRLLELEDAVCEIQGPGFWGGGKSEYLIPGMQGYDAYQKRRAAKSLFGLPPPQSISLEQTRGEVPNDDPTEFINRFVFPTEPNANPSPLAQQQQAAPEGLPTLQFVPSPLSPVSPPQSAAQTPSTHKGKAAQTTEEAASPSTPVPDATKGSMSAELAAYAAARATVFMGSTRGNMDAAAGEARDLFLNPSGGRTAAEYLSVEETERAFREEKARCELLTKQLNALVKKNRRLLLSEG